jgi:NADH-quinone oxidoreductase subunit J
MLINILFKSILLFLTISSFFVIFSNHPIFSLLFLILSFILSSFLLFLLECELLALLFITIYAGAIAILFLFAVMMLDFKNYNLKKNIIKYIPIGTFFGLVLLVPLILEINNFFPVLPFNDFYVDGYINWYDLVDSTSESEALGQVLYTYFVIQFLLAGLILLVVLFGVVHLMTNFNIYSNKQQVLFKQVSKSSKLK